jgi:CAAX protease family protein
MGQVRRRLTPDPTPPEGLDDRLSGTLFLDALSAAFLLTPLPLIITANTAVGKPWANLATVALCGSTAGAFCLYGLADMTGLAPLLASGLSPLSRFGIDAGIVVTGFAAGAFAFKPIRRELAGFLPFDPESPVHALALVLAILLFGFSAVQILFTDVLASIQAQPSLSVADIFFNEVPFLILAIAGVGLFVRRNVGQSAVRLGLVRPAWWHVALAFAAVGLFVVSADAMHWLGQALTPGVTQRVDATEQHVFGQLGTPLGIAALALLPGLCEDVLFRGALQPRLGLIATALLFTSIHTDYGLSLTSLSVFVLAIGLGLIRKYTNTTTSCTCHAGYNLLAGIGIAGPLLNAAVVVEVALLAVTAYGIWSSRRGPTPAPTP